MTILIRFSDDFGFHDLGLTDRDCGILIHRDLAEGEMFCRTIGVFDFLTVSRGITKGTETAVNKARLGTVAKLLLQRLLRDEELLSYDYSCTWVARDDLSEKAGGTEVLVSVHQKVKGFCKLLVLRADQAGRGREIATFDLREKNELWECVLSKCTVKRRRADFTLVRSTKALEEFLNTSKSKEIRVTFMTDA